MREQRRYRGLTAGVQTGLRQAHLERRLSLLAHQVHHSARGPSDNVGPVVIFAGTGVAERRNRRVAKPRIETRERLVAEPDRFEIAERMRLDEKVRVCG